MNLRDAFQQSDPIERFVFAIFALIVVFAVLAMFWEALWYIVKLVMRVP